MKAVSFLRLILLTGLFLNLHIQNVGAQTPKLHLFVATQNDSDIGSPIDKQTMLKLADDIKSFSRKEVSVVTLDAANATESYVDQLISATSIGSNDAVWFYYSGHGETYDQWPMTDETELKETWVHNRLKQTRARLTLVTYDCCNWREPVADYPPGLQPKSVNFITLFFQSKGNYISASSKAGQYSYGSVHTGGMYSSVLMDALKHEDNTNWDKVFAYVKSKTQTLASQQGKTQEPVYASENAGITNPIAAPSLRVRRTDTVDGIIQKLEVMIKETLGISVKITKEDLIRWNPGFNGSDLTPWIGKKLNYEPQDPLIRD